MVAGLRLHASHDGCGPGAEVGQRRDCVLQMHTYAHGRAQKRRNHKPTAEPDFRALLHVAERSAVAASPSGCFVCFFLRGPALHTRQEAKATLNRYNLGKLCLQCGTPFSHKTQSTYLRTLRYDQQSEISMVSRRHNCLLRGNPPTE